MRWAVHVEHVDKICTQNISWETLKEGKLGKSRRILENNKKWTFKK
jgi:hypothetical protein